MKKSVVLLVAISLIGLWPFLKKGYFESHDGEWMVIRFSAFHQTLRSGQFPVRFVDRLNNNFGYPVLNFLYPLPFYLAEIPKILGFNFQNSIKIVFIFSTLASVILMYLALAQKYSKEASFSGAIVYLYAPYRFVDLYVRGSLGESVAFIFPPLCLLSIFKISKGQNIYLPILSLSVAFLITSHNVISLLFLPLILLTAVYFNKNKIRQIVIALFSGILIASFFWLPAIYDLKYVKLSQINVSNVFDHLVDLQKLIFPTRGFGPNPSGLNSLPVHLGVVSLGIIISAVYNQISSKKKEPYIIFLCLIFIVVAFLMTNFSKPFWEIFPSSIIQFPWRMLSLTVFITSVLTAYLINQSRKKTILALITILASIISAFPFTLPSSFVNRPDSFYSTNESTTTVSDEYLPIWVKAKSPKRASDKLEAAEGAIILDQKISPAYYQAKIESASDTKIQVNTIYFPGWQVKVDKKIVPINFDNPYGLINFSLPKGTHKVIIRYSRTPVHFASEIISLTMLILTGTFFLIWRKRSNQ